MIYRHASDQLLDEAESIKMPGATIPLCDVPVVYKSKSHINVNLVGGRWTLTQWRRWIGQHVNNTVAIQKYLQDYFVRLSGLQKSEKLGFLFALRIFPKKSSGSGVDYCLSWKGGRSQRNRRFGAWKEAGAWEVVSTNDPLNLQSEQLCHNLMFRGTTVFPGTRVSLSLTPHIC